MNRVAEMGTRTGQNIIAYSGGVDSSLVAYIVHRIFYNKAVACIGISASLSAEQYTLAKKNADHIGIHLIEVITDEGSNSDYISNEGMSCYYCKTELYSMLQKLYAHITNEDQKKSIIYNGTNADDKEDPTRVGLKAAFEFHVMSPLDTFTKNEIREIAHYVGLPNWDYAAAPCLRSRLQFGVHATEKNLKRIEETEHFLRTMLHLHPSANLRVRHLADNIARIEADEVVISKMNGLREAIEDHFKKIGFTFIAYQSFQSGSLSRGTVIE